jgi:transposase InsO family protein
MPASAENQRRRVALLAWIEEQGHTQCELHEIQDAIREAAPAEAEGWVPDISTLSRWLPASQRSRTSHGANAQRGGAADPILTLPLLSAGPPVSSDSAVASFDSRTGMPQSDTGDAPPTAASLHAELSGLPACPAPLAPSATRERLAADIQQLDARAACLREVLERAGALSDRARAEYGRQRGWMGKFRRGQRSRRGTFDLEGCWRRYHEMWALNELLLRELNDAEGALSEFGSARRAPRAPLRIRTEVVPVANNSVETAARRQSVMPFAADPTPVIGPTGLEQPAADVPWGVALATTPRPAYAAIIGYDQANHRERDGMLRAQLLAPMLTAGLTAERTAELWRRFFRGRATAEEQLLLPTLPDVMKREAWERYPKLSKKTLEKWRRKARQRGAVANGLGDATAAPNGAVRSLLATPPVSAPESSPAPGETQQVCLAAALVHRNSVSGRKPRKLTPELKQLIRKNYLREDPTQSETSNADAFLSMTPVGASTICRELRDAGLGDLSERTVQRYIAQHITDAKRILARGGVEAAEMFRIRLIRQVKRPNQVWIMDHSFFKKDRVDEAHPEWLPTPANNIDFAWAFERVEHGIGKTVQRRVVEKMSMTLIIDAYSRRKLALRVWEGTPSTEETLAALRDAVLKFGVPENLYTDNGGDLTSGRMMGALVKLGITSVRSQPYCPQGRGPVERDFGTIKREILPLMPGFVQGPDSTRVDLTRLQDHEAFEADLWKLVDARLNHRKHHETGEQPALRYDNAMCATRLLAPSAEHLVALLSQRRDAVRRVDGLHLLGGRYAGPGLEGVPEKARVHVYIDPYRPKIAYVAAADHEGRLRFTGLVERYGHGGAEAPQYDVYAAAESAWREDRTAELRAQAARRQEALEREKRSVAGEAAADRMLHEMREERERLLPPATAKQFSAPKDIPRLPASGSEPSATVPDAAMGVEPQAQSRCDSGDAGDSTPVACDVALDASAAAPSRVGATSTTLSPTVSRTVPQTLSPKRNRKAPESTSTTAKVRGTERPRATTFVLPWGVTPKTDQ